MSLPTEERAALIGQLVAMRNVLDGMLESLEQAQEKPACEHPEEQRKYGGDMGNAHFICGVCGATVAEVEPISILRDRIVRPASQGA